MPDYKLRLSKELDEKLQEIARRNNLHINELLLNAVSVYSHLKDDTSKEGMSIGILDAQEKPIKKVTIP